MSGTLIRCPPFCRFNCNSKHHPLLVALLNCADTAQEEVMQQRIQDLQHVIERYQQAISERGHVWKVDNAIPDVLENYRFPLIHWACALGCVAAAMWLIKVMGVSPALKSADDEEATGIHRALLCLQGTCPKEASKKFEALAQAMVPALVVPDKHGATPLHICCGMLANEMPRHEFYMDCLRSMVKCAAEMGEEFSKKMLNAKNLDGNTALHLLCRSDKILAGVKILIENGADVTLTNDSLQTAAVVALESGQYKVSKYFNDLHVINQEDEAKKSNTTRQAGKPYVSPYCGWSSRSKSPGTGETSGGVTLTRKIYDSKGNLIGEQKLPAKPVPRKRSSVNGEESRTKKKKVPTATLR